MSQDRDYLHRQLVKLGDMMGDGLHYEPDGKWIEKEYRKICKKLNPEMFPKKDFSNRNKSVSRWCETHQCQKCNGKLKQTRSGSLRVVCESCGAKYQLKRK